MHVNSRSGSKIDFYATRTVDYQYDSAATARRSPPTEITMRNDAPTDGVPGYVIEPTCRGTRPATTSRSSRARARGPASWSRRAGTNAAIGLIAGEELDRPWFQDFFTTPGGDETTPSIVTHRDDVWQGNSSGGTYRLIVLPQTTVKPTETTIEVEAPAGTHVTWTSEPMTIDGPRAVWTGVPQGRTEIVVRFRAPAPSAGGATWSGRFPRGPADPTLTARAARELETRERPGVSRGVRRSSAVT